MEKLPVYNDISYRINFYDSIGKILNIKNSCWSYFDVNDFNKTPEKEARIVYYDGAWGKAGQIEFDHPPTWGEIWQACDKLILESGDNHHSFIEGFEMKGKMISFYCGS
mgnify:CR=1 FL=1